MSPGDLLAGRPWQCAQTAPGEAADPATLAGPAPEWMPAAVPGTVAGALRDAGRWDPVTGDHLDLEDSDWWFTTTVSVPADGRWLLECDGLATVAEVWLGDRQVLASPGMFLQHRVPVPLPAGEVGVAIAFRALAAQPVPSRPRARWRLPEQPATWLRWWRTSVLGHPGQPGTATPVGPWRPVRLVREPAVTVAEAGVHCQPTPRGGRVSLQLQLAGSGLPALSAVTATLGDTAATLELSGDLATGSVELDGAQLWWPHGYGGQPRYDLAVTATTAGGTVVELLRRRVGFRSVDVDTADGRFALRVNGVPVFARGAVWAEPDPVSLVPGDGVARETLTLLRDAGATMVRRIGDGVYADDDWWDACDELGLLVWSDLMLGRADPPDHPHLTEPLLAEMTQEIRRAAAHPCIAVICGGDETAQQPALLGLRPEATAVTVQTETLPTLAAREAPGVPVVPSAPWGGFPVVRPDVGVSHWWGAGAYLRPPEDTRRAAVRFAAACLAISSSPERTAVARHFGGAARTAAWRAAVPRDPLADWDFEDVRDHYVRSLYAENAPDSDDPERDLDLGRAAVADLMTAVMTELRRPGSPCAGALVLSSRDSRPGAGWGLIDVDGEPKSSWWALRRVLAPVAVTATDEGLSGLRFHLFNDGPDELAAVLAVRLLAEGEREIEAAETRVTLGAHSAQSLDAEAVLGRYVDVTQAYRLGSPLHDTVVGTLRAADGTVLSRVVHHVGGLRVHRVDLGLTATLTEAAGGWQVEVSTRRLARHVVLDVAGYRASEAWFDLVPGEPVVVGLRALSADAPPPRGTARALNGTVEVAILAADREQASLKRPGAVADTAQE